jgi:cellulose synthase/poly-beta-1,6-N-acetylglucosamine synthase-like glycosyltransferase
MMFADLTLQTMCQVLAILLLTGLAVLAAVLAIPVLVLTCQILAAPARPRVSSSSVSGDHVTVAGRAPRVVALIPAHDESAGITRTLASVMEQLGPDDRVLVVADNCSDNTAAVARAAGAMVVERHDTTQRGKGYALDYGMRHLAASGQCPDVVVIIDADCLIGPDAIKSLTRAALDAGRPAQALYLMHAPAGAGLKSRVAEFAWLVRNQVRPLGWHRLGCPCQLMGTGMAFPWSMLSGADLASGAIVEDMELGLDLARAGQAPVFCPEALVWSEFPTSDRALAVQRTRWEHGHLHMLLSRGPRLLGQAIRNTDKMLAAMTLDLLVPPIVSLTLLVMGATGLAASVDVAVSLLTRFFQADAIPFAATSILVAHTTLLTLLVVSITLAWHRHGRHLLSASDWLSLPAYVLAKLPMYTRFIRGKREQQWVRTERRPHEPPTP